MVHKSDLSWTVKVNNPADLYHKGDDVEAIILSINHDEKKVSLGIKQLVDDPWPTILNDLPSGTVAEGTVISLVDYGIYVRIREGIEALIPSSDVVEEDGKKLKVGDVVKCEIANLDTVDRRVTATMKDIGSSPAPHPSVPPQGPRGSTLGDLIKEKLGDKLDETLKR
jgi:small subunit ribosomal protein S1